MDGNVDAENNDQIEPQQRQRFGGILNSNLNAIRSSAHSTALMGLLQLARGQGDGIVANLDTTIDHSGYLTILRYFSNGGEGIGEIS